MNEYLNLYQKWIETQNAITTLKTEIDEKEQLYNSKNKKQFNKYGKKMFFKKDNNELLSLYKKLQGLTDEYGMLCHQRFSELYSLKYDGAKFEDDKRWWIPDTRGDIELVPRDELLQELRDFEKNVLKNINAGKDDNYSQSSAQIK